MIRKYAQCTKLALLCTLGLLNSKIEAQKCAGGLDSIQQVCIDIACAPWVTVTWTADAGYCYGIVVGGTVTVNNLSGKTSHSITFSKNAVGIMDSARIVINEKCGNQSNGCADSGTLPIDVFIGVLPPLDSAGTWKFQPSNTPGGLTGKGDPATNTQDSAVAFTPQSPTNIPDLSVEASFSATTTNIVRPTCMMTGTAIDRNGMFTITATFGTASLDSLTWWTFGPNNMTTKVDSSTNPIVPTSTQTSTSFTIKGNGMNIPAGTYTTKIFVYAGTCVDSITVSTVVPPGSNEPVLTCNSNINLSVDGQCMADINVSMVLAGVTNACMLMLMDSLVIKHSNGVVIPTVNIGSGTSDTVRIENARAYIGKTLIVEVHSSNNGISNSCWGNLLLEDKLAPILTCDTLVTVPCLLFDGNSLANIKVVDCDTNPTINLINEQIIVDCNQFGAAPNDSIFKRIIRTFYAVDKFGNVSNTCTDTLDIRRLDVNLTNGNTLDLPGLIRPLHYQLTNDPNNPLDTNAFVCDVTMPFADQDNDGIPDPVDSIVVNGKTLKGAGVPKLDTIIGTDKIKFALHPSNVANPHPNVAKLLESCKTVVTFSDIKFPTVGCVRKVVRTWTIREFVCNTQRIIEFQQFIEIVDTVGPAIQVAVDMKVPTNLITCARKMQIPGLISITDNCDTSKAPTKVNVNVRNGQFVDSISTDAGTFSITGGGMLDIPFGKDTVIYQAFDACHNITMDTMIITVEDHTAPVVICKEFLVIGLADDGVVKLPASSIDNGTFDDCGLASFCVVRMIDLTRFDSLQANNVGNTTTNGVWYVPLDSMTGVCGRKFTKSGTNASGVDFIIRKDLCTSHIEYCCEDATKNDTVLFQANDKSGNVNQCMVEIEIQDKRVPSVYCPPDLTIDCRFSFTTDSIFGNVVPQGQQKAIIISDSFVLGVQSGKSLVDGVWFGNCSALVSVSSVNNVDQCGTGTIQRTFTVAANGFNTTCTQTITFSRQNVLKPENVVFPADITMQGCSNPASFPPDSTGSPMVLEESCTLIGNAYQDLVVRFNNNSGDACFKILREWTVIDWCKTPSVTLATGTQQIEINDTVDPVINGGQQCPDTVINVTVCNSAAIVLTQQGFDACTSPENLLWTVQVDLDNNGTIDDIKNLAGGDSIQGSNSIGKLSASYQIGTHKAIWELRDQCGNSTVCEQTFRIQNATPPNAICRTSLTGHLNPIDDGSSQNGQPLDSISGDGIADGGELIVWASEYDLGSSTHPCNLPIIYSFDNDAIVHFRRLTCADYTYTPINPGDSETLALQVFVLAVEITTVNGQQDTSIVSVSTCNVNFVLFDNPNTCDTTVNNPASVIISGNIYTQQNQNVANVEIDLLGVNSNSSTFETVTDRNGMYRFPSMSTGGSYTIFPALDRDILNGVSTLDLVLIQKHILGLQNLKSPYYIIAADANNDKIISAIDLIKLRRVILAISERFTNNTSWRFVEDGYQFEDQAHPLKEAFSSDYEIRELERNMIIDFVGIKVGDVNGTVNVAGLLTAPRSHVKIELTDNVFTAGQVVKIPVSFSGLDKILGYQFDLAFDPLALQFSGFSSEIIPISSTNFGTQQLDRGIISTSWHTAKEIALRGKEAFVLEFEAKRSGRLSEVTGLSRGRIQAEVYSESEERIGLSLEFLSGENTVLNEYYLYQNTPNPFAESTAISFVLPKDEQATLSIYDVTGKLLKQYSASFTQGMNTVHMKKSDLRVSSGVLLYTLETDTYSATREMIFLD